MNFQNSGPFTIGNANMGLSDMSGLAAFPPTAYQVANPLKVTTTGNTDFSHLPGYGIYSSSTTMTPTAGNTPVTGNTPMSSFSKFGVNHTSVPATAASLGMGAAPDFNMEAAGFKFDDFPALDMGLFDDIDWVGMNDLNAGFDGAVDFDKMDL